MLRPGQHLITTADCYRRTRQFCDSVLQRLGIGVSVVPAAQPAAIEAAVQPTTRLVLSEAPTNPYLYVLDLEELAAIAQRHRLRTLIDSTFATPFNQNPLRFGIDLVMHSATKYLGGHNDLLAGVIVGRAPLIAALREAQGVLGGITDPNAAYLLIRGLKTFALRMQQHNANGMALATFLEHHPRVRRVYYPACRAIPATLSPSARCAASAASSASRSTAASNRPAPLSTPCRSLHRAEPGWRREPPSSSPL